MALQNFVAKKKGIEQKYKQNKNDKKENGKKEKHIQRKIWTINKERGPKKGNRKKVRKKMMNKRKIERLGKVIDKQTERK
jgi:hypothetical protein